MSRQPESLFHCKITRKYFISFQVPLPSSHRLHFCHYLPVMFDRRIQISVMTMSVVGAQPKRHANRSYKATKHVERSFLISDYYWFLLFCCISERCVALHEAKKAWYLIQGFCHREEKVLGNGPFLADDDTSTTSLLNQKAVWLCMRYSSIKTTIKPNLA